MDMLTVGNEVTIKVKNVMWPVRHRYANGVAGPEFNVYTGAIVREKWFGAEEIGITTGNPQFPFRRIHRERIVEVGGAKICKLSCRDVIKLRGRKRSHLVRR